MIELDWYLQEARHLRGYLRKLSEVEYVKEARSLRDLLRDIGETDCLAEARHMRDALLSSWVA
jgi:hypothetical protein